MWIKINTSVANKQALRVRFVLEITGKYNVVQALPRPVVFSLLEIVEFPSNSWVSKLTFLANLHACIRP